MPVGRPKGSKNGDMGAAASKSRNMTTKINPDAKPGKIAPPEDNADGFNCVCCGKHYVKQKGNFPATRSPLFAANNYYLPFCRHCIEKHFEQLVDYFSGNEEKAIDRICQIADWYYRDDTWAAAKKVATGNARAVMYPSKMVMSQSSGKGTTYLDTIRDRSLTVVQSYDDFEDLQEQGETGITKRQIKQWGLGFEEAEYKQLDEHYRSLKESIDTNDVVQDTLAKDLCEIKIQQIRARNKGDVDTFQKLTKLYQDTLKSANLKVRTGEMNTLTDDEVCWGNFIRDVEKFAPAEIYRDRKLFADVDGFKEYLERHVLRPVRNFFMGTREMDPEFSIGVDDEDDN